jgi:hypothetical protein
VSKPPDDCLLLCETVVDKLKAGEVGISGAFEETENTTINI